MTALEIVQAAYPGIPVAILNQFSELLPAEAAAIDSDFANTDFRFYQVYKNAINKSGQRNIDFVWTPDFNNLTQSITILNPTNAIYRVSNFSAQPWQVVVLLYYNRTKIENRNITTIYDSRIFDSPVFTPGINNVSFYKQSSHIRFARNDILVLCSMPAKKYNGITSIHAAIENGIIFDADPARIEAFATYISAYKKFSTQIEAEKNLLEQQARTTLQNYRQQLDDQAAREYADLQAKKIQLLIAIDNEAKSAQRDFQNMLLTAQGLKSQLRGELV